MGLSRDRKQKRARIGTGSQRGEDVDPMNYLSNLADAMLVLAVGIMVALVLHWNVNLQPVDADPGQDPTDSFTQEDLRDSVSIPENAEPAGEVYYDAETGSYYFVRGSAQDGSGETETGSQDQ